MRIDQLDVVLRPRSQWEAMELGTALVRRHAGAIWKPWLLLTLPVFALLNLLGVWLDSAWLPAVALWWLKPVFERIPLYVISRGAFGAVPDTRQTLRAQCSWGWRGLWAHLLWRRLSPARSLLMPVDLLEGGERAQRRRRRRTLGGASYGHASLLTAMCWHFEVMLQLAGIALVFMFVPVELLSESLRAAWSLIGKDTPVWAWIGFNFLAWIGMTLIGPFYSGAGFGLYLNRRTQLEAWDVEIAFRRLRERLTRTAPLLLLAMLACLPLSLPLHAQEAGDTTAHANHKGVATPATAATPATVFGTDHADTTGFRQAAARAHEDPQLGASRSVTRWQRKPAETSHREPLKFDFGNVGKFITTLLAVLSESLLWIVVGAVVVALLLTSRWWLPWLRGSGRRRREPLSALTEEVLQLPETLPADIIGSARQLWRDGKPRHALALLYRAAVEVLGTRAAIVLPPGATEAHCLRAAQRMPLEADRQLFVQVVRTWQYAAYAGRLPDATQFETLLAHFQQHGWTA